MKGLSATPSSVVCVTDDCCIEWVMVSVGGEYKLCTPWLYVTLHSVYWLEWAVSFGTWDVWCVVVSKSNEKRLN